MTALFYVWDTVDREIVKTSEHYPGDPCSAYRPVYWLGVNSWWRYDAVNPGERSWGKTIDETEVPELIRLHFMVAS